MMIELTQEQIELVSGGLKWNSTTCGLTYTVAGTVAGGLVGGWAGAGAGFFVGEWFGDNFCPSPELK